MYYERMIASNLGHRSAHSDAQLALCTEDEFAANASNEVAARIAAAADPGHERMRQRLEQERKQRAALQERLQVLRKAQTSVAVRFLQPSPK